MLCNIQNFTAAGGFAHLTKDLLSLSAPTLLSKCGLVRVVDGPLLADPFLCLDTLKGTPCTTDE